jgi:hypothetical protein
LAEEIETHAVPEYFHRLNGVAASIVELPVESTNAPAPLNECPNAAVAACGPGTGAYPFPIA